MTKKEKVIAAQAIVMLEELYRISDKRIIKDEARRLIEELEKAIDY